LSTKSFLLRQENTLKRTPDINVGGSTDEGLVVCSNQRRNMNLLTSVFSEMS